MGFDFQSQVEDEMAQATVAGVNKLMREMGIDGKLYAGRGYYYWSGNAVFQWPSVGVYRIGQVDLDWMRDEINSNVKNFPTF